MLVLLSVAPERLKRRLHTTGHFHYLGHLVAFAITAAAVTWGASKFRSKILRAGWVLAFGIALESAEVIAYHGWFEKRDAATDVVGVTVGLFAVCALQRHIFPAKGPETSEVSSNGCSGSCST